MKTTIKKLLKLGLEEKDIKKELDINDKKYNTMKERNTQIKVDNVPELLDKYNNKQKDELRIGAFLVADKEMLELSKLLDKIYESLNIDKLDISIKDKSDIVKNIPNFIENIRKEVGIKKVQELEKQIERINKQIEELKAEYKIDTNEEDKKADGKKESVNYKNYYFILNEDIKFLSPNYKLGKPTLMVRISKDIINSVKPGDVFHIKEYRGESRTYVYTVVDKRKSGHMRYLKLSCGMNAGTI